MANIYNNNLLAIKKTNINLFKILKNITTNETFEVYMQNDPKEANILDRRDKTILYAARPIYEIENRIKELQPYNQYRFLYIFGVGNGYLLQLLLKNPSLQKIYVFEPEIELIYIILNLIDFSSEILLGKLNILHTDQISFPFLNSLLKADEKYYFKSYNLFINTSFYEKYQNEILTTNQTLIEVFRYHVNSAGNDYKDELLGLDNFLENLPIMLKNPSLKELVNRSNIAQTAIIVATGPSLHKQLPLLKEIQDKVAIISVDASMPILENWGIKPDIVTSIERVGATAKFYKNISKEFQKDIVFAVSALADDDILYYIKDGIKQLSMRSVGNHYKFFRLDEWGYLGEGMSSANLAYELASMIGYKSIVFIGQDLAFGENFQSHSEGHIFGKNEIKDSSEEEYNIAYGGNGKVKTRKIWKMFLNGLEKQIYKNNLIGNITTINATEGGSRIEGTKEIPFKTFCQNLPNIKKEKIILKKPDKQTYMKLLQQSFTKTEEAIKLGNSMYKQASKLLSKITQQFETQNIAQNVINNLIKEINKIRNKYYKSEFTSFYINLLTPLIIHVEYDIYKIMTMPENSPEEIYNKNMQIIQIHQEWLKRVIANVKNIIDILQTKQNRLKEYNENDSKARYAFYDSLKDSDLKLIPKKDHDTITFFADFLNYSSIEFVNTIKHILIHLPNIKVKAVCFDKADSVNTKRVFDSLFSSIECITPKDVNEFLNITDIYIKDKEFASAVLNSIENLLKTNGKQIVTTGLNKQKFNTLTSIENINYRKDKFEEIKVYKDNKQIDILKPKFKNNLADIKAKCFEYMIDKQEDFEFRYTIKNSLEFKLYMPKINDEKFYEYSFVNSLDITFDESFKDVCKKDSIGFLATENNMGDKMFLKYLTILKNKFKHITFNIFYFTNAQKNILDTLHIQNYSAIRVKTFYDIQHNCEIFLINKNKKISYFEQQLVKLLTCYNKNILLVLYSENLKNIKIKDVKITKDWFLLYFLEEFGLTKDDVKKANNLSYKLMYDILFSKIIKKELKLDIDKTLYELKMFDDICYAFKYPKIKQIQNLLRLRQLEYLKATSE